MRELSTKTLVELFPAAFRRAHVPVNRGGQALKLLTPGAKLSSRQGLTLAVELLIYALPVGFCLRSARPGELLLQRLLRDS